MGSNFDAEEWAADILGDDTLGDPEKMDILFDTTLIRLRDDVCAKLVGAGAVGFHGFQGQGVALSADGNTAIWSADDGESGPAWVFTRSNGVWTQQGPKLALGASSGSPFSGLSTSVALSADGNAAIVGASGRYQGDALVFTRSGGIWSQQGFLLVGTLGNDLATHGWPAACFTCAMRLRACRARSTWPSLRYARPS